MTTPIKILVIGSGLGSAVAAKRLAEAGCEVVMLERGPWPLGGACLGASSNEGVVGASGQVFDNPGLYVADASALAASPKGHPV